MRTDRKTGASTPWGLEFGRSLIQVPLGQVRPRPALVDEDAVTLKVPVVPPQGLFRNVPRDVSAVIGSALLMACFVFTVAPAPSVDGSEPLAQKATEIDTEAPVQPPASDRGPVLAAVSVSPRVQPLDAEDEILIFEEEDDVADDEIIIFEEPPAVTIAPKSRAKPKRSRSEARSFARQGRDARKAGNRREAKKHYRAALAAWPTHATAAAALAELYLEDGRYRQAVPYAKRAADNAPTNAEYQLLYGDALFLAKRREAARQAWKKSAALGSKIALRRLG